MGLKVIHVYNSINKNGDKKKKFIIILINNNNNYTNKYNYNIKKMYVHIECTRINKMSIHVKCIQKMYTHQ